MGCWLGDALLLAMAVGDVEACKVQIEAFVDARFRFRGFEQT